MTQVPDNSPPSPSNPILPETHVRVVLRSCQPTSSFLWRTTLEGS